MSKASKRNPHNIPLANNFNNQLSNTYRKYLADKQNGNDQQLVNKKFIEDLTSFIGIASNCGREVSVAELKYLKLFWLNYNEILNNPLHKATVQDIKNLASYSAEQWLPAAQQVELTQTLFYIQDKAINLQLGDVKYCNRILENIEQWWSIPATGLDVVRLIERRFNKVALIKYKKYKFDENISKEKIEGNIFLAACRSHNKEYLDEVITEFSLNLATLQIPTTAENYWIQQHNTERTHTPLEGLTFITPSTGLLYITNKAFKKDYANLIFKEKRIHPDSDKYRADFSKLNYMTTLMLCSVSKDFEEAQENASLLIEFGADVNLVAENHLGIPRTAASFAMGNTNYKLLEYLGEQGADLGKAPNILGEIVKGWCGGAMPPNLKVIPTSISPELRGEKFATHWQKVCLIIERFFLKKITSTKTFTSETIETDQTDDVQREEKLITEYIEFKEQIQDAQKVVYHAEKQETSEKEDVTAHNITNKFDLLLLKLIQKSAKINLEEKDYEPIQQLTIQHPELECYAISSILNEFKKKNINNKADTSLVENILGYKPEWLHKFFLQKKQFVTLK